MKKLLLFWIALLAFSMSYGQSVTNYAFAASSGTFTPITGGTSVSTSTSVADFLGDTKTSTAIPIGFTFIYMGVPYTQLVAMSDGYISFNLAATSSLLNNLATSSATQRPLLAPLWDDLDGASGTGAANYKTEGTAGSRIFTIEWLNWQWNYNATGATISFQIKLYEGTGKIEFIYTPAGGAINSAGASIGITGIPTGSGNYLSLNGSGASPTVSSTSETTTIAALPAAGQVYSFTPTSGTPADPTTLTFTAVTGSTTTVNWVDNSSTETYFVVTRATDAAFTQNVVISTTSSTTIASTGTAYNSVITGLFPNTIYYYKIQAANESSAIGTGITGSQQTLFGTAYYWVGTTGGTWSTTTNWNTAADGTGSARTTSDASDILIVDGDGIVAGGATTINVDVASFSLGQFKVTSNTNLTLQSSTTTTRTITLIGGTGSDFVIENGSTLSLNNATMAVAFAFTGTGNTGDISGTINFAGSASNTLTTTGGTGTLVNVSSTGVVNLGYAGNSLVGSTATLNFDNGAKCNSTGATTGAPPVPLATWAPNSTLTISGLTSSTTSPTNNVQSFGNVTYNCPAATGTYNFWGSTTTSVVKGDLNIVATNTGRFRAVSAGTVTVNGNINVVGGSFQVSGSTGTVIVLGNVNVSADSLDIANGVSTLKVAGNFIQTGGKVKQTNTGGLLEFNGTSAQTFTVLPGLHGTNAINVKINNAAGVNLTSNLSIRNLTVTNGNLDGAGVLTYNGTSSVLTYNGSTGVQVATAAEFPAVNGPSSLTVNNSSTSPNNMVVLPFSRRLNGTSGVLTLTDGLLSVPTNVISVSNTATTAISGGSDTSYVFGGLERDLPANLVTGTTYKFPVGKSKYNPFVLVNPTTNAGGTVTVLAEAFDGNCGGTAGALLQSLKTNRYWSASITAGGANFTNSLIQLNDSILGADAIAGSSTINGTYDIVGGTAITATATSLTSTAPASTTLPGFFVMANKSAPVVSNVVITPAGNQCTNVARTITATVTPGGGAVTGVVINYSINGTAQTPITMTNVSGNDWSGIIPTVTPANANVTWSVVAADVNLLTGSYTGTAYKDEPNFGVTATASASETTVCSGASVELTLVASNNSSTPTYTAPPAVSNPSTDEDFGNITITQGATTILNNTSTRNTLDGTIGIPTGTAGSYSNYTAFGPYNITQGQTYNFSASTLQGSTGYGNAIGIYIDYNRDGDFADAGENVYVSATTTTGAHTETGSFTVPVSALSGVTRMRILVNEGLVTGPTMSVSWGEYEEYSLNVIIPSDSVSWSDGSVTVGNTNPLFINPVTSNTYTGAFYRSGCPIVSNGVLITANPLPSTPTANNSTQCGVAVPTCSVTSTSGAPSPTFNWYDVPTGGTPLAGITGATYTGSSISTTTYFYVSEFDGTCESPRVMVTATVGTAPALTITTDQSVCNNAAATLSVTSLLSDFDSYVWTPATDLYTDAACTTPYVAGTSSSTVYYKTNVAGVYTITCSSNNSGNGCSNVATSNVTVLPSAVTATAVTSEFCNNGIATINVSPTTGFGSATFQWMESTDNTIFSDIVGANAINYTTPLITDTMYYKMVVELGASVCTESNVVTINVKNPQVLSSTPATRCGDGTVTLNATSTIGTELHWYDVAAGGMSLATGTSFTTPVISTTTSYWVDASYVDIAPGTITIGNGTSTNIYYNYPTAFGNYLRQSWHQFVITAAELQAAGLSAGNINSIAFNISATPTPNTPANDYTVSIGNTSNSTLSAWQTTGLTVCYGPTTPPALSVGWNTLTFTTPYLWDGVSNILVDIRATDLYGSGNATTYYTTTAGNTMLYAGTGTSNPTFWTSNPTPTASTSRFNTRFSGQVATACTSPRTEVVATVTTPPAITVTATPDVICLNETTDLEATSLNAGYTYTWEPGTLSGATQTVTPTGTTTYNVTASDISGGANDGCIATGSVLVTVNPVPTVSASANDSIICLGSNIDLFTTASAGTASVAINSVSFENAGAIPTNWAIDTDVDGNSTNAAITFETGTTYPSGFSPTDGSYLVRFNSYSVYGGNSARLRSTAGIATTGKDNIKVSFDWLNSSYYTNADYMFVEYSLDGITWTVASDTIFRFDSTNHWTNMSVDLPAAAANQSALYLSFYFMSAHGNDCYLDNVVVSGADATLNYSWTSTPSGFTSTDQNPAGVTLAATTTYIVAVENVHGCVTSDDVAVTVNPLPVVNLGPQQDICDTSTITLDAGNPGSTYDWSTGGNGQTEDILGSNLAIGENSVSVTVTTTEGCIGYGEVVVYVTVCDGIEDPSLHISYYPNPATNMLNLDLSELPTGDYRLELLNMQGQKVMDKILINDGTVISVNLMDIAPGSYVLSVSGNNNTFRNYLTIQE